MSVDRKKIRKSLRTNFNPGPRDHLNRALLKSRQLVNLPSLWRGGRLDRPIFIIGAPRSGTSLLYSILRTSSRLAHWPGEAHEVWEADFHPALRGWESNAATGKDALGAPGERIRREFFLATGGRKRLIDKTPRNALRVPFVDALFPDARYVFLKRDGRENVNSLINAWRTPRYRTYELPEPHAIPGADPRWWKFVLYPGWRSHAAGPLELVCANQWKWSNDLALEASADVGAERWLEVRYENLVKHPVDEVGRLMAGLELPYENPVAQRAAATRDTPINIVTPPERGKWKRENPQEIRSIEDVIAETMGKLGYRMEEDG
jgi:hypothetical protein